MLDGQGLQIGCWGHSLRILSTGRLSRGDVLPKPGRYLIFSDSIGCRRERHRKDFVKWPVQVVPIDVEECQRCDQCAPLIAV